MPKTINIGKFIGKQIEKNKNRIEYFFKVMVRVLGVLGLGFKVCCFPVLS